MRDGRRERGLGRTALIGAIGFLIVGFALFSNTLLKKEAIVLVIGHRGSPGHLPDHTLEGYRLAFEQGADFIEPDLVSTKDGVLIARHENDLTHTTDVRAKFPDRESTKTIDGKTSTGFFSEDFTLAEIKTLRAVQPYPTRPHDHDGRYLIPTFDEILALRAELSKTRPLGVYPETKHPTYFRELGLPLEDKIMASLQGVPRDAVFLQSFELNLTDATYPRILLVWDEDATPFADTRTYGELLSDLPALRKQVEGLGVHKDHLYNEQGATGLLERAHAAGLAVHVYTFRDEPEKLGPAAFTPDDPEGDPKRELRVFYELGVDGVFADHPDTAVAVRDAM